MLKITAELIEQAALYTNAVRDRELELRGYKIPVIENLGATLDQFDAFHKSDLDFWKVKLKERQEAEKTFNGKRGAQFAKDIARRSKSFNPGAGLPTDKEKGGPSAGDVEAIKNAIANASTLAEVERLIGLTAARPETRQRAQIRAK
ncbi:U2 small nuclear ribonucleoprotein A [Sigmodon hispidus]